MFQPVPSLLAANPGTHSHLIEFENSTHLGARSMTPKISVVIPTLNEADNLPHVLPRIPDSVHEVLLVDGRSTDGTIEMAQRLLPRIRIVLEQERGKGAALRAGFAAATGDIIVMLDADGSTDPAEIPAYVGALTAGADFAKGSRFLQGGGTADMPIHRRLGNWGFVVTVRLFFGGRYSDLCYGYNAFWKRVLPLLELDGNGFEIETMMNVRALRAGLKVVEIPSFEAPRVHGVGRLQTFPDGWRVLKTLVRERFRQQRQVVRSGTEGSISPHASSAAAVLLTAVAGEVLLSSQVERSAVVGGSVIIRDNQSIEFQSEREQAVGHNV